MVSIKLNGLKGLQAQIKALPVQFSKRANQILQNNTLEMARNAKRDVPVDFGRLKGAITASKSKTKSDTWDLSAQASYAPYIEFGTKGKYTPIPGIDASEFKGSGGKEGGQGFYDAILAWVKRKGIAGQYSTGYLRYQKGQEKRGRRIGSALDKQIEDEQAAFAIYLSIMRHGIKPHPFFFKQAQIQEPMLIKDFQQLINEQRL